MLKTTLILLRLSMMPSQPEKDPGPPSEDATYVDLSGPSESESDLPEIVKKGSL